jgi:ferric-dicitrate binding protein FerR (iron transport regulator)
VIFYASSGIAASLLITLGIVKLSDHENALKQYSSGYEVSAPHTLPDGSIIELNQNTTIKYPEKFNNRTREVSIFGEAFFEIKPNSEKPFIVHSAGLNIKVLGTKFNVKAYPGQETVKVFVSSGTVLVYPNNVGYGEELGQILSEGEQASYNKQTGLITKGEDDDLNSTSWKTGVLTFKETPLSDVFNALEERYNKKFIVGNKELLDKRLTARFEDLSFEDALEALALIFEIKYENGQDQVKVY